MNQLLKDKLVAHEAPEPSNVIWENLHFTGRQRFLRACLVALTVMVLLIVMFVFFVWLAKFTIANALKYPSNTDCEAYQQIKDPTVF